MCPESEKITGLIAATFTPLTPQGELNLQVVGQYVDFLLEKQGVRSVFGTEAAGGGMVPSGEREVIVHVGCLSIKESQELARHAATVGADAIAVIAPSFFKPRNAVTVREVLEGIEKKIPSFRGLKFSGVDLTDLGQCVSYCRARGWSVLYGVDEFKLQDVLTFANSLGFDLAMNKQLMSLCSGLPMGPPRLPLLPWPSESIRDVVKKLQMDIGTSPE
ncbi:N-acetylneuraminate lyase [Bagarius yarrelli]|uniref:N-acetylneuraminate lyase n=1 Tax=Bagarius yarrelli TaxID=175774 RepID=A0A556VC27_BAGYA|nr:N-acetylneuraminate lyase [Bagarius yarrelli]